MIVDCAIYRDGRRTAEPVELAHMDDAYRAGGGPAWFGLYRPTEPEFAWAAILFAPTFVATVYGMNLENMPEMTWELGYPVALALMAFLGVALYVLFKRRNWM